MGATEGRVRVFVQQAFSDAGTRERVAIQGVLDLLESFGAEVLTGGAVRGEAELRAEFRRSTGLALTPRNLRMVRQGMLDVADAMVIIRTGSSEEAALETAYNIFAGPRAPIFLAEWTGAGPLPMALRDLGEYCPAEYVEFERAEELSGRLAAFLETAAAHRQESEWRMIRMMEHLVA